MTMVLQDYVNNIILTRDDFLAYRLINDDPEDLVYIQKKQAYDNAQNEMKNYMETNTYLKCLILLRSIGWL